MHQDLLCDLLSLFKTLIEIGEVRKDGHRAVDIPDLCHAACKMLARWLYGQPLFEANSEPDHDLSCLAELCELVCDVGEESSSRAKELTGTCVEAIRKCLAQTNNALRDPIDSLSLLLARYGEHTGKAVILRELVYGECATDGRTKLWLEQFCAPGRNHAYRKEIVEMVCLEFAKKACEQHQNSSSANGVNSTT